MDDVVYINGVRYVRADRQQSHSIEDCYEPTACTTWTMLDHKRWRCNHGTVVTKHPNGWCTGGCCR